MAKTINDAIIEVLKKAGKPLTSKEIMEAITKDKLYHFKAASPENIVRNQLRRHSENVEKLAVSAKVKYFILQEDGKYKLK